MFPKHFILLVFLAFSLTQGLSFPNFKKVPRPLDDKYRPQIHFSIAEHWINDPNGMVYLDGEYHLYYQYYPNGTVWGPMHWGHSVSTDLVTWTDLPIALYPDDLGQIFSGSAVADTANSSGFQTADKTPIVAIFTHAGNSQQQSIAYSNDNGRTFEKFEGNPVIPNPDIADFRDPKVIKYNDSLWVLVLAAGNKIMFYGSENLKNWELLSEFGAEPSQGSHAGVWECPDLLQMTFANETVWVLIVSTGGGPNGGSVTQYFVGDFDGKTFTSSQMDALWMDWGTDNYAAVSFQNEPQNRPIMIGWMNNWDYANELPTNGWRGQMTLPRVLGLTLAQGQVRLQSTFPTELQALNKPEEKLEITNPLTISPDGVFNLSDQISWKNPLLYLDLTFDISQFGDSASIAICFLNSLQQEVCVGFDEGRERNIFLDRTRSGLTTFNPGFSRRPTATREIFDSSLRFQIYLDVSAIELFADSGLTCMTALFYPDEPYTTVEIRHHSGGNDNSQLVLSSALLQGLKSMAEI